MTGKRNPTEGTWGPLHTSHSSILVNLLYKTVGNINTYYVP